MRIARAAESTAVGLALLALCGGDGRPAMAQSGQPPAASDRHADEPRNGTCPQGQAPRLGEQTTGENLSQELARSHGVICPPSGVDPQMTSPPPGGGRTPVIPPPGTAPGDRTVPK